MKLRRTTILQGIETVLTQDIMPILTDDFAQNDVRMAAALLAIDRTEREHGVALLVEEHDRLRGLFASAAATVSDPALKGRLENAAAGLSDDLRLSALEGLTGQLRDLLVELHVHAETRADEGAADLDRAIWCAIRDTERARSKAR